MPPWTRSRSQYFALSSAIATALVINPWCCNFSSHEERLSPLSLGPAVLPLQPCPKIVPQVSVWRLRCQVCDGSRRAVQPVLGCQFELGFTLRRPLTQPNGLKPQLQSLSFGTHSSNGQGIHHSHQNGHFFYLFISLHLTAGIFFFSTLIDTSFFIL